MCRVWGALSLFTKRQLHGTEALRRCNAVMAGGEAQQGLEVTMEQWLEARRPYSPVDVACGDALRARQTFTVSFSFFSFSLMHTCVAGG